MNAEELRAIQAPLKSKYKEDATSAHLTLRSEGKIQPDGLSCNVNTHIGPLTAGLHPATGGDGRLACSAEMLLEALVSCAGVTIAVVATATGTPLNGGRVTAEGDLDFRGTLGINKEVPVGFKAIRLTFALETTATAEQLDTLIRLTERYCVVYQTLKTPPSIEVSRLS